MDYAHVNHHKFLLVYHIVLVTKYRHKLFELIDIKRIMKEIELSSDFEIIEQESDSDHILLMIKHSPKYSPSSFIKRIKMMSTQIAWRKYKHILEKFYWKNKILWSAGFFVCTIGNASMETIRQYIQEQ